MNKWPKSCKFRKVQSVNGYILVKLKTLALGIKLKELEALLVSHDWYYHMSDDYKWYKQGRRSDELIRSTIKQLTINGLGAKANELYNKYNKIK